MRTPAACLDLALVVDVSYSTAWRMDGTDQPNDRPGRAAPAPKGSVLDAELNAFARLIASLDPHRIAITVLSFSGDHEPESRDVWTEVQLTNDYALVLSGLERIRRRGGFGMTNTSAAIDQARRELLLGVSEAARSPRMLVLITDGVPTLPHRERRPNERAVALAVERAAQDGVQVYILGVGRYFEMLRMGLGERVRIAGGGFFSAASAESLERVIDELTKFFD